MEILVGIMQDMIVGHSFYAWLKLLTHTVALQLRDTGLVTQSPVSLALFR